MHCPLISLDCDGVLSDFLAAALDAVAEITGRRYQTQEIQMWNPWLQLGLQPDETERVFEIIRTPGFCEALEVMPGAQRGVERLSQVANIVVVTSPWVSAPTWAFERFNWLERHFGFGRGQVIHADEDAKSHVAADFFVDDHAVNVRKWGARQNGISLLWSQPHNRNIHDLPRVNGWEELYQMVSNYAAGVCA